MYQYQCCAKDFLCNGGIDHLLFIKTNHWATERRVVIKILYKPMARVHDKPGLRMEEHTRGEVELPRSCTGDSPDRIQSVYYHNKS